MTKQISFTKFGNKVLPIFRQRISKAESTEDCKKFFFYTSRELFDEIFSGEVDVDFEDISLTPNDFPNYMLSDELMANVVFTSSWSNSDLPRIVGDLARTAMKRYIHLQKKPEKSEAKIRM